MGHCIFCEIAAGRAPASIVARDDRVCAFLDIQPVNPGHLLVVPVRHAASLADLNPEDGAHLFRVAQKLTAAVRHSAVRCEGVTLLLADGKAAGQEVFHVHLHVIPRFSEDGFGFRFGTGYSELPSREDLDRVAASIRAAIEDARPSA